MAARQHFSAEALAQATHSSSTTWADLVSLNWTPDADSNYAIFWSYANRNSSNITSDARGKIVHDGVDYAINNNDAYNAADYPSFSGLIHHQSGGSPTEINTKISFQAQSNGNVIQAKLGRLVALKLSAADFYAETLSAINHGANTNFEDALVQSITVPSGGRTYLAIGSFEQTAGGSTLTCRSRLSSTSAGTASGEFGGCLNDSAGTNPVMLIWRVTLAAGSQDVRLQYAMSHTTGGTLTITNRRMVLIELDGLDGEEYANLGTDDTTTNTSYEDTPLSLTASISANPQLVFGAWATAASTTAVIGTDLHQDGASLTESVRQSYSTNTARSHSHSSVSLLSGHGAGSHSWLLRHKTSTGTGRTKASASIAVLDLGADSGGDGNATGASLSVSHSLGSGAATGTASASGADQSVALSLVGGAASSGVNGEATGASLSVAVSASTGAATGASSATGSALSVSRSISGGAGAGSANAAGSDLSGTRSITGGAGTGNASATGASLSQALSVSGGAATGNGEASGSALPVGLALVGGAASSEQTGDAAGASLLVGLSLVGGTATGAASATGAGFSRSFEVSGGAASGNANATGSARTITRSFSGGAASAAFDGNATGANLAVVYSIRGGRARGPIDPAAFDRQGRNWQHFSQSFAA